MIPRETRKQQIARRLGVSVAVLEQYLQAKWAEVDSEPREPAGDTREAVVAGRTASPLASRRHP